MNKILPVIAILMTIITIAIAIIGVLQRDVDTIMTAGISVVNTVIMIASRYFGLGKTTEDQSDAEEDWRDVE